MSFIPAASAADGVGTLTIIANILAFIAIDHFGLLRMEIRELT